jgi:hypothetical protein
MVLPSVLDHREAPSWWQSCAAIWTASIRSVNKRWRLIFQWDVGKGEASGVYLDDHSYK